MDKFSKYVGLDVHQETIAVAVADIGGDVRYVGEIGTRLRRSGSWLRNSNMMELDSRFATKRGRGDNVLYRQLRDLKQDCQVVAPSLIPRKPGERVKTDRRDSLSLARLHRAGELTAVSVPGEG
jgi:transposase